MDVRGSRAWGVVGGVLQEWKHNYHYWVANRVEIEARGVLHSAKRQGGFTVIQGVFAQWRDSYVSVCVHAWCRNMHQDTREGQASNIARLGAHSQTGLQLWVFNVCCCPCLAGMTRYLMFDL